MTSYFQWLKNYIVEILYAPWKYISDVSTVCIICTFYVVSYELLSQNKHCLLNVVIRTEGSDPFIYFTILVI